MKIGIDARLWQESGVGRYLRNLIKGLLVLNNKNTYVLFVKNSDAENLKSQISNLKNNCKFKTENLKIIKTDIVWHSIEEQIKFPRLLNKENLDLMHFPYFSVPIFYNKPFIVTIHDLIIHHFSTGKASTLPFPIYKLKRYGYSFIISQAVKNSKKIIVPLKSTKNDLIKTLNIKDNKIEVTYEGYDKDIVYNNCSNNKLERIIDNTNYFMYVGNAYPHKNLERLIMAFQGLKNETNLGIKLFLVGKEDYFYKKLKQKIDLGSDIKVFHDIEDKSLSYLYHHAKALIAPSLIEGFGLTPVEAMVNSCPVIASNIASFKEVCEDSAIYFDPLNTDDLKDKMKIVYNLDSKKRQEIITKGLKRSKVFSWETMAQKTLKIYEDCNKSLNK